MTERESAIAGTVVPDEARAHPDRASEAMRRTVWVIVLTLPVTIVALAIAFEIFGLVLRLLAL
ncbi:hypothetical protein [Paraburkholderia sp. BCC1885]|uniref:hypothetical protein n=1 Tax=Paraburkholderia sp. BCC1885 TaxID=2562669 RepID=UPI001183BBE1|nr:hypothetical protein [Paraburkholderia sp. BCC1885]